MSTSQGAAGGIKEIVALVHGRGAYSRLKFESGVHRVQRVPATESQGRIHTSAVTVAVLAEADELEIDIDPKELKIDVYRSSGPGGQSVNTTDSAVRVTHLPTNMVVPARMRSRSTRTKRKRSRSFRRGSRIAWSGRNRTASVKSAAARSVRETDPSASGPTISPDRVTDHRIGLTLYKLELVMEGDLDPVIDPLAVHFQAEALKTNLDH